MAQSCEKVMGQCQKVREYCEGQKAKCDKKKEPVCEEVLGKCERASEQCEREKKEACGKPRHWFAMEPIDKVIGERPWQPDFKVVDRPGKKIDPGLSLMTGVWVVLGGLATMALMLAPLLNNSEISSSNLPTPLIPALPGFPWSQSLFLPPQKLENHEKCGLVGGGKVGTLLSQELINSFQI